MTVYTFMFRDSAGLGRSCYRVARPNHRLARLYAARMLAGAHPVNVFVSVHVDGKDNPGLAFLWNVTRAESAS